MTATWKSVSEPYWDGAYIRIDCEAQNLDPTKTYLAKIYHGADFAGQNVLTDSLCIVSMTKPWMDNHGLTPPFDVDVKLVDHPDGTVYDSVTRTIPELPWCEEGSQQCVGYDLQECINNQWVTIKQNSESCGYVPPPICTEGDQICIGNDLYECQNNEWVLIESESEECIVPPPPDNMYLIIAGVAGAAALGYLLMKKYV